ncbi:hypothetical protein [Metamycoplasma hominis]|uniref:hypothetical protein n=1 Tax=Metamycoplasma hominis TaxID=2098 RepID=UPI003CF2B06A
MASIFAFSCSALVLALINAAVASLISWISLVAKDSSFIALKLFILFCASFLIESYFWLFNSS